MELPPKNLGGQLSEEAVLLFKMREMMKSTEALPFLSFTRMTCEQLVESWNLNKHLNFVDAGAAYGLRCKAPGDNFQNSSETSERIADISIKLVGKYIQNETASSYTCIREQEKETSSARKRRLHNGISPGRRLSHLARRRQIFSRANLQQMSQQAPKYQIAIRKNDGPCNGVKECMKNSTAGVKNLPKRALFQSPDEPPVRAGYKTIQRQVPRRRLFDSNQGEQCLPGGGGSYDVSGWLASQPFSGARKRGHDDPQGGESKRRCPRRSLDFSAGSPSHSSDGNCALPTMSSASHSHITSLHKQKLLWAVATVLKEKNMTLRDKGFKTCGTALYNVCKQNLPLILSAAGSKRTSEKLLDFARLQVDCVLSDNVVEKEGDPHKKPLLEVTPSTLNKTSEVRESPCKGKENTVKTPKRRLSLRKWQSCLKNSAPETRNVNRCSSLMDLRDRSQLPIAVLGEMPAPASKRKWASTVVEMTPEKPLVSLLNSRVPKIIEETPEKSDSDNSLGETPDKSVNRNCHNVSSSSVACIPASEEDEVGETPIYPALMKHNNSENCMLSLNLSEGNVSQEIPICAPVLPSINRNVLEDPPVITVDDVDGRYPILIDTVLTAHREQDFAETNDGFGLDSVLDESAFSDIPVDVSVLGEIEPEFFACLQAPSVNENSPNDKPALLSVNNNNGCTDFTDEGAKTLDFEKEGKHLPEYDVVDCERGEDLVDKEEASVTCKKMVDRDEDSSDERKACTSTPTVQLKKKLVKIPAWKIEAGPGLKIKVRLSSEWNVVGRTSQCFRTPTPNNSLEISNASNTSSNVLLNTSEGAAESWDFKADCTARVYDTDDSPATSMESYNLMELRDRLAIESTLQRDESDLNFDASDLSDNYFSDSESDAPHVNKWVYSRSAADITDVDRCVSSSNLVQKFQIKNEVTQLLERAPRKSTPRKWKSGNTSCQKVEVSSKTCPEIFQLDALKREEMLLADVYRKSKECLEGDGVLLENEREFHLSSPRNINRSIGRCKGAFNYNLELTGEMEDPRTQDDGIKNCKGFDDFDDASVNKCSANQLTDKANTIDEPRTPFNLASEAYNTSSEERRKTKVSLDAYKARKQLNMNSDDLRDEPVGCKKIKYIRLKEKKPVNKNKHRRSDKYILTDSEATRHVEGALSQKIYYEKVQTIVNAFQTISSTVEQEMKFTVAAVENGEQRCCKLQKLGKVNHFAKGILKKFTSTYES